MEVSQVMGVPPNHPCLVGMFHRPSILGYSHGHKIMARGKKDEKRMCESGFSFGGYQNRDASATKCFNLAAVTVNICSMMTKRNTDLR